MLYQPEHVAMKPRIVAASKLPTEKEFFLQVCRQSKDLDGGKAHKARLTEVFTRQNMDFYFVEVLLPEREAAEYETPF